MKRKFELKITSDKNRRTFTIREYCNGELVGKYRTYPMARQRFNDAQYMTENDWKYFLHACDGDYYKV